MNHKFTQERPEEGKKYSFLIAYFLPYKKMAENNHVNFIFTKHHKQIFRIRGGPQTPNIKLS